MSQKIVVEALIRTTLWGIEHRARQLRGPRPEAARAVTCVRLRRGLAAGCCSSCLLVALPILEVWLLIQVGQQIGVWPTLAILVVEALLGAWLMRHEGTRAWKALNDAFTSGKVPTGELADAALILVGGVLLMMPGFVTDIFGFLFLLPFTRPFARKVIAFFVARRMSRLGVPVATGSDGPGRT